MRDVPQFIIERAEAQEPVFTADEIAAWPDGLLDQLLEDAVLKPTDNAASVTCDACGHDHVEKVEYIESPPGTELRAYISCPENGRVRVPLSRLRRWIVNTQELPVAMVASPPRIAPSLQTPIRHAVTLPHALVVAHSSLTAALDEAIDLFKRTVRFPYPGPVIEAIERFVHELHLVPEWFAELERRAALVEGTCAEGSAYDKARGDALNSHTATPQALSGGKLAIQKLRGTRTRLPAFVSEVVEAKLNIDTVLEEPSLGLTSTSCKAFGKWRHECRKVQREAERLEVDGCWYLYHIYLAAEPQCSEASEAAKGIMQTNMGGVNLEPMLAAANSLVAWVLESAGDGRDGLDQFPSQGSGALPSGEGSHEKNVDVAAAKDTPEDNGQWFTDDPPAGGKFAFGPLEGTLKGIADWMDMDQRTIKKLNGRTSWCVKRVHGKKFVVWFSSQAKYAAANQKRLAFGSQKSTK